MRRVQKLMWAASALGAAMVVSSLGVAAPQAPPDRPLDARAVTHPRAQRIEERLERLSKELNLTEDQKEKIRPILKDEVQQLRALRQDTSLSQEDRREKALAIRKSHRQEIAQILTPEQREKLKQMREEAKERREERREQKANPQ